MVNQDKSRSGLRIRGHRGHPIVRQALIKYARWLRSEYEFPIRVPVYLLPGKTVPAIDGKECSAGFFAPDRRTDEPIIRIATGDYAALAQKHGRYSAPATFIISLSHEIIHYFQWLDDGIITESGVTRKSISMMRRYEKTVIRM